MRKFWYCSVFCIGICLTLISCNNKETVIRHQDFGDLEIWADTITYEVLIQNPDSLNTWETEKLKHVNNKKIVDDLFGLIYTGKKKAYNYYTNDPFSIDEIKEMETDKFPNRNHCGKLQFTETWAFSEDSARLVKKIQQILVAYEVYNDSNKLRGYKAAFYLKDF